MMCGCEHRRIIARKTLGINQHKRKLVPLERFELPTLALRKPCSTPELQRPYFAFACLRDLMPLLKRCKFAR